MWRLSLAAASVARCSTCATLRTRATVASNSNNHTTTPCAVAPTTTARVVCVSMRACHTTASSSSSSACCDAHAAATPTPVERISLDDIVIEAVTTDVFTTATATTTTASAHEEPQQQQQPHDVSSPSPSQSYASTSATQMSPSSQAAYCDVTHIDPYARSRIVNFLRRMGEQQSPLFHVSADALGDGRRVYVATCRLRLPEPHRVYVAEGMAETAKDAELLSAMHAERVCDALGVPLFRLPSMQEKYARAVRLRGRYAPLPGEPLRPEGTPVPPPLRMIVNASDDDHNSHSSSSSGGSGSSRRRGGGGGGSTQEADVVRTYSRRVAAARAAAAAAAAAASSAGDNVAGGATTSSSPAQPLFARSIAEAELVDGSDANEAMACASGPHEMAAATTTTTTTAVTPQGDACVCAADDATRSDTRADGSRDDDDSGVDDVDDDDTTRHDVAWVRALRAQAWQPWRLAAPLPPPSSSPLAADAAATLQSNNNSDINSYKTTTTTVTHDVHAPAGAATAAAKTTTAGGYGAAATLLDATEQGAWQLVNVVSTRFSPTPHDALLLPCVYEPAAYDRIVDYFLQHGLAVSERLSLTHVATSAYASRMYVAELQLVGVHARARGKATRPDTARALAAMHAELLLDALAQPLFPRDAARQSRHARAVARYGRWAPDPARGDTRHPHPHAPLPLPLKQQQGVEDMWLDGCGGHVVHCASVSSASSSGSSGSGIRLPPSSQQQQQQQQQQQHNGSNGSSKGNSPHAAGVSMLPRVYTQYRSESDRMLAAHNVIALEMSNVIEVNPPAALLDEAVAALRAWQRDVVRNPYRELFVLTRMGDFVRASTVTPVPRAYGVRGGNAVGRNVEQAIGLCALNALDALCALGIPVYRDAAQQRRYMHKRHLLDLFAAHHLRGLRRAQCVLGQDAHLHVHVATRARGGGSHGRASAHVTSNGNNKNSDSNDERDEASTVCGWYAHYCAWQAARGALAGGGGVVADVGTVVDDDEAALVHNMPAQLLPWHLPQLPGYLIEGTQVRLPPSATDTVRVMQLCVPDDVVLYGRNVTDVAATEMGNLARIFVQNYLRHVSVSRAPATARAAVIADDNDNNDNDDDEEARRAASAEVQSLHATLSACNTPHIYIAGYGRVPSVYNTAYMRIPLRRSSMASADTTSSSSSLTDAAATSDVTGSKKSKKGKRQAAQTSNMPATTSSVDSNSSDNSSSSRTAATATCSNSGVGDYVLAVGVALKKKDAERACYLHAMAMLRQLGEDVAQTMRANLPRLNNIASYEALQRAADLPLPAIDATTQQEQLLPPFMHPHLQSFIDSNRYATPPRRR